MPPRSRLTPWIESLILSYGSREEAGSTSTSGRLKAHVIGVGQMTQSQARGADGPTGLLYLSDGVLQIPAVLTASGWEHLQEQEERECFSSLLNTTVFLQDYRLQFHMDPEQTRCRFFLSVGELATTAAGPVKDNTPCCTSLASVRMKICRTWRSLLGQEDSQQWSQAGLDLSELLGEWQHDCLQTLLRDVRERLTVLRSPRPSTSAHNPSPSGSTATSWDLDRVRYRGEPSFSVPGKLLIIPEGEARQLEADAGGGSLISSVDDAEWQIAEPAGGEAVQGADEAVQGPDDAGGEAVQGADDAGGEAVQVADEAVQGPDDAGGETVQGPDDAGGEAVQGADEAGGEAVQGADEAVQGPDDAGGEAVQGADDAGGEAVQGADEAVQGADDAGGEAVQGADEAVQGADDAGGEAVQDAGWSSPPLLDDVTPLTVSLPSNPWDMFPPPCVSSSTSDSSPDSTPSPPRSKPDSVAVVTSAHPPVHSFLPPYQNQPPSGLPATSLSSSSATVSPPEPPASDGTETPAVLQGNHRKPKRKRSEVSSEAVEEELSGSPPSWLFDSQLGASGNEEGGYPEEAGAVPRKTPSIHSDGRPFSYSYRVSGQNLLDFSQFRVAASVLHWAVRYLLSPKPTEGPQSVD